MRISNYQTLSRIYKKHGIRRLRPLYTYHRLKHNDKHIAEKKIFIFDLLKIMSQGKEIIYFDEVSVGLIGFFSAWHPEILEISIYKYLYIDSIS